MAVTAVLGTALVRILISDSQFVSRQDAMVNARQAARAAMNTMSVELRMVSDSGLLAAQPESVTVRVPFAFGMTCSDGGLVVASQMPADSLMYASATADGVAWRDNTATYTFVPGITVAASTDTANCTQDSIRIVPGGRLIGISGIPAASRPPVSSLFYLYQTITYRFGSSSSMPGRIGLWRKAGAAAAEELVTPFDTSAKFVCLVGTSLDPQDCPPGGGLAVVQGLELRLVGQSDRPPQGKSGPESFALTTQIPFLNKVN